MSAFANPDNPLLRAALDYAERGWLVLPLHTPTPEGVCSCGKRAECTSPGKHPRLLNGLKDASTEPAHVARWWRMWPDANIGIVTGPESGLVVIDVDTGHDGAATMLELEATLGELPDTIRAKTGGGGYHVLLNYPTGARVANSQQGWQGVDVRGDGGYIVAAPSLHASGEHYAWHEDFSAGIALADIPPRWLDALTTARRRGPSTGSLPPVDGPIAEGNRNQVLTSLAGSMRRRGMSTGAIDAALQAENLARCTTPLNSDEVEAIARSVGRYQPDPDDDPSVQATTLELALALVADIMPQLKADPAAIANPRILEALCVIEDTDKGQWIAVEHRIRTSKTVLMTALRGLMRDYRSRLAAAIEPAPAEAVEGEPISLKYPDDWRVRDSGIWHVTTDEGQTVEKRIMPVPLWLTKRLRSIDDGTEKVELKWIRDGGMQRLVCERSSAFTSRKLTELADQGLPVNSESSSKIVRYLSELEAENLDTIPVERCTSRAGWVGVGRFYPGLADDVCFAPHDHSMETAFRQKGDYASWRASIGAAIHESDVFRLVLAASFAAPLLKPLGHRSFALHVWGDSGGGKTATLKTALSAWGNPHRLCANFNTTAVGLEHHLAMMCDVPCGINERQAADRNVDQLVYMMGEGKGRTRGAKSGGLRHTAQWRTIALTNGEEPISRTSSAQGVRTRTIEVEAVPFDDESVAHNLYDAIDANYGHAGPAFVAELVKLMPEEIRRHHDLIHDRIAVAGSVPTYHAALAIIALADYYAMQWIFGAAEGEAFAGAVALGLSFLEQMPTKVEGGEALREYDEIMHLVVANRTRFSLRRPGGALANGEEWGVLKDEVAYFSPQVLQRELERLGFRFIPAKRRLAKSGRLFTESDGEGGERLSRRLWSSRYIPILLSSDVLAALPDTTDENDRLAGVLA